MEDRKKREIRHKDHRLIRNFAVTVGILGAASAVCLVLQQFVSTDTHVPLIFVLAVLCISRFTDGYVWGVAASVVAVIGVNYVFTYPYFKLNFTLTGYPLTFLVMLAVSLSVCTLTTRIKKQEQIRLEIEKEKTRVGLLRAVSHDIRTPLTSIVGASSAILENDRVLTEEEKQTLLSDIRQEAEWLNRMVENLLSVTRLDSGNGELRKSEELLEEVIGSAVTRFEKRLSGVEISVRIPEEPLLISVDPILIEQVLINLMDNAVSHGETTTVIRISAEAQGDVLSVSVCDNGQGFPEDILTHLFDGTLPLRENDRDAHSGMRIGLSVCRSIIKAHGGALSVKNLPEGGAGAFFTIPL